jgi:hypothetical protein
MGFDHSVELPKKHIDKGLVCVLLILMFVKYLSQLYCANLLKDAWTTMTLLLQIIVDGSLLVILGMILVT